MKIEVKTSEKIVNVPTVVKEEVFVIELNREEAEVLRFVTGSVGGTNKNRVMMNSIYSGLANAGAERKRFETEEDRDSIYFDGDGEALEG